MIRRFLSNVVIVVLLVAWGYSAWQTQQLRKQVSALQIENSGMRMKSARPLHSKKEDAANPVWLAIANAHIARAGDALSQADPDRAEREMAAGAGAMQQAVRAPIEKTEISVVQARDQVKQIKVRLAALQVQMNQLSAKTGPHIRLLHAQADKIEAQAQFYWQAHRH